MASLAEIQTLVQRIKDDLPLLVQRSQISPRQVVIVEGLSDISERLGLVQAGEFRAGNGLEPGFGFSGVRTGYPAFVYDNETWNIVGIDADALQVGIRASDGKLIAGGGDVRIDRDGIHFAHQEGAIYFDDSQGDQFDLSISSNGTDFIQYVNDNPGPGHQFIIRSTDLAVQSLLWREDGVANRTLLQIGLGAAGGRILMGAGVYIYAGMDGTSTVFNEDSFDIDFRIEGASVFDVFKVDAGQDRVEIGADHYFPTRSSANPNGFWNEANQDMDFTFEGDNTGKLLRLDAGLDKATSFRWDGWQEMDEHTWTRTGNHTFTVSGDVTAIYRKGAKVRYKDGGSYEYGVIASSSYSSPNTTVNLIPNTDYTMAAATITDKYISYIENPEGWPDTFNYTVVITADAGSITSYTINQGTWKAIGKNIKLDVDYTLTDIGTATGSSKFSTPVASVAATVGNGREAGVTGNMLQAIWANGGSVVTMLTYNNGGVLTNNYQVFASVIVPF